MFHVANEVGRLLEVRVSSPPSLSLYEAMVIFKQIYRVMPRERGLACVIADLRGLESVEPEVIDFVTNYMRMDNPYVERNAILLSDGSAPVLEQSEQLMQRAALTTRRAFRRREEAEKWIGEVLSDVERARLRLFLNQAPARTS